MAVVELNEVSFKEFISSDKPVIVDFWANWCMPCVMLSPVFEKVSEEYSDKLGFGKIHTVDFPEIATEHNIEGIPCLVVFKNGKEIGRIIGLMDEFSLKQRIDAII